MDEHSLGEWAYVLEQTGKCHRGDRLPVTRETLLAVEADRKVVDDWLSGWIVIMAFSGGLVVGSLLVVLGMALV